MIRRNIDYDILILMSDESVDNIALIDRYRNFKLLTNNMLNEFVEKLLIHEREIARSRGEWN
ncbi:MAG: DUF4368 domain-containing protein [Clostridiales bacterium]|nr:DUF4368 domain-containing protein [Clostridiales bacterium]